MNEAEPLPAPPREVRFAAAFGRRALLGVVGGFLLLVAAILAGVLLTSGSSLPFDDHALDAEHGLADAEVIGREPLPGGVTRLTFRYAVGDRRLVGRSYGSGDAPAVGARGTVEFLRGDPETSRLRGTTRAAPGPVPWPFVITLAGAGVLVLMLWLRSAVLQRQLLRDGAVVDGRVEHVRPVPFLGSRQIAIEFTFHDRDGTVHTGRQWRWASGGLGRAVLEGARAVYVVHDPAHPSRCSLAAAEDFVRHGSA
ncbi:MAG TPA: hypothetical protein VK081_08285 [Planctomycetota bacterium]|nr:hypothetical protein [Planctomycetota bacterium]